MRGLGAPRARPGATTGVRMRASRVSAPRWPPAWTPEAHLDAVRDRRDDLEPAASASVRARSWVDDWLLAWRARHARTFDSFDLRLCDFPMQASKF